MPALNRAIPSSTLAGRQAINLDFRLTNAPLSLSFSFSLSLSLSLSLSPSSVSESIPYKPCCPTCLLPCEDKARIAAVSMGSRFFFYSLILCSHCCSRSPPIFRTISNQRFHSSTEILFTQKVCPRPPCPALGTAARPGSINGMRQQTLGVRPSVHSSI
jgi:hypothetical protein